MHEYKKTFREYYPLMTISMYKGERAFIFFFPFDRWKEHWLIGLSDASSNEQLALTVGGKLAWSSFCRTELMKPLWIKLKCAMYHAHVQLEYLALATTIPIFARSEDVKVQ